MAAIHDLIAQTGDERLRQRLTRRSARPRCRAPRFALRPPELIPKRKVARSAERFVRLEIDCQEAIQKLLLVDEAWRLDALFDGVQ